MSYKFGFVFYILYFDSFTGNTFGTGHQRCLRSYENKITLKIAKSPGISVVKKCKICKFPKSSVSRAKKILKIRTLKKKITPKYVKDQQKRAEDAFGKLYRQIVPSGGSK